MRRVKCQLCSVEFETQARNHKYCDGCRPHIRALYSKSYHKEHYVRRGYNGWGENNNNWKGGLGRLGTWYGKVIKRNRRYCAKCRVDLIDATHYQWCIHHIDRNRQNNDESNLMLLCKKCHQTEHECWKAFEGATTISKESTTQESGKRPAPEMGDDIVSPSGKPEES